MSEPWFDGSRWAWLPGTVLGCLGGLWGAVGGTLAPQGRAQGLVLGMGWALVAVGVVLLAAGVSALVSGQPYAVWYGLGFPGLLVGGLVGGLMGVVRQRYREAEGRRIESRDLP